MNILIALIITVIALCLLNAWGLAIVAKWLKSPRPNYGRGLFAVIIMTVIGLMFEIAVARLNLAPLTFLLVALLVLLIQVVIAFALLKQLFRLSFPRAMGLYGIYFLGGIVQLVLVLAMVRPYLAEAFILPNPSMAPTLNVGDRFIVNKLERPQRWDLIVYKVPGSEGPYCKRLVGLPGERLKFDNGNVYVNDVIVQPPQVVSGRYRLLPFMRYQEGQSITLGSDEFFVIGDNVDRSYDSRSTDRQNGPHSLVLSTFCTGRRTDLRF